MAPWREDLRTRWNQLPTAAESRSALALLRHRRWQKALLGVILISVVFVFLGRWQFHRHEAKAARNDLVKSNYSAPPVPLANLWPQAATTVSGLPARLQWRRVIVTGSYLVDKELLARNRPNDGEAGYEVVVPLRTDDGQVIFVDRGWIPAGSESAARPDAVPQPPTGQVTVVARLRPSEPSNGRDAPAGQISRIDIPEISGTLDPPDSERVVPAYGVMASESPPAPVTSVENPLPQDPPESGLGINLAYAFQWWAFAIAAYVLLGVGLVREIRRKS